MSLKAELETWASALKAYDEEDFEKALDFFSHTFRDCTGTRVRVRTAATSDHTSSSPRHASTAVDRALSSPFVDQGLSVSSCHPVYRFLLMDLHTIAARVISPQLRNAHLWICTQILLSLGVPTWGPGWTVLLCRRAVQSSEGSRRPPS